MAYNVSTLPKYVEQQNLPLLKKAIMTPKTLGIINIQTGVKSESALNILSVEAPFQDGSDCGFSAAGEDKLSQRTIKVTPIKVNKEWCDKDLRAYWAGYEVKTAANAKALPFEADLMERVTESIASNLDMTIWQGDVEAGHMFNGFITTLKGEEGVIKKTLTATAFNATNIVNTVKEVYLAIPSALVGKATIMMGIDAFRIYQMALVEKNLYHYDGKESGEFEIIIPGTNTKVVGLEGLSGSNVIFGANPENLYYGCDLEGDKESIDLWYSQDDRKFKLAIEFLGGVQVAFPDEVVMHGILG